MNTTTMIKGEGILYNNEKIINPNIETHFKIVIHYLLYNIIHVSKKSKNGKLLIFLM